MPASASPHRPRLANAVARRLFLAKHGLSDPGPEGKGVEPLLELIGRLGFVQIDSINTVERAHHMILAARRKSYRPAHLKRLLERDRTLFEHWTHDAAAIPTEFFPFWRLRFERHAEHLRERWRKWRRDGFEEKFDEVLAHVRDSGPVLAREVGDKDKGKRGGQGWWDWKPEKTALEYLWRTGRLSVAGRESFQKIFDLTERVIPDPHLSHRLEEREVIDWACESALDRLGFATSGEIAAFWETATPQEAKAWCGERLARGELIEIDVECAGGALRRVFARPDVLEQAEAAPPAPGRLRVLSPFDPALRDRARAERLFDFHYRIEVFVPEAKRRYGYYVFPLMEGDRLVGRIDMKRSAVTGALEVRALWPERGVTFGKARFARLDGELHRMARFSGVDVVSYGKDWAREPL